MKFKKQTKHKERNKIIKTKQKQKKKRKKTTHKQHKRQITRLTSIYNFYNTYVFLECFYPVKYSVKCKKVAGNTYAY